MSTQVITTVESINQLADLMCDIDINKNNPKALAKLVGNGHDKLVEMLGKHEHLVYGKADGSEVKK